MNRIKKPCENCGGTSFIHATEGDRKSALVRVHVNEGQPLKFQGDAGTPVDVYLCQECGMFRLFAVPKS